MSTNANVVKAGLEGIVATQSEISDVDGIQGRLIYRGYDIHDLAEHATFEEVIYLLWNGDLPNKSQLDQLKLQLAPEAGLPPEVVQLLSRIPPAANPMDMLRTAVSLLSFYDPDGADISREANIRKASRLVAKFPTIVTTFHRMRN